MDKSGSPPISHADAASEVTLWIDGHVAEIGLSNGPLNLVTRALLRSLNKAIDALEAQADLRCVIVHGGSARAFCAGSDIKEFAEIFADASERKILFEDMVLRRLARLPAPTIAAMDGPALGGGLEIALACDLRVCRAEVVLGLTESRLGGLAGNGSLRLTRLIGPARAKEMLFTGNTISAQQALAWGLVNRIAETGAALETARALALEICARGPLSNRLAKQLVDAAQDQPLDAALSLSTVVQQRIFDSHDLHEGVAAFFAKREPEFLAR
ncbi:enoyl-CoA hydratase/isomerase family protein [Caballeronia sp. GACF4]|uniref:enoyl-CoA hydratase/isomerase family protein n=1 Tax=Caballeronia sp. GACF4 TaxID=2921763 RepID=UPI00202865DD|nr:enoyl-CoA hydratase/isomerase family protein [Caballeronia sp. GACF4]